jgi:hypothetical protein
MRRGEPGRPVDPLVLARYARPQLAAQLASLLDSVTGADRPVGPISPRAATHAARAGGRSE